MSVTAEEVTVERQPPGSLPEERPCLRRDLEFTHRQVGGTTEVIVCDPLTSRYFRAGELEAALFARLDGETTLDEITAHMRRDFPQLPGGDVPAFVAVLNRMGFIETSSLGTGRRSTDGTVAGRTRVPFYRRLSYMQLRIADPDRLFTRLVRYVGWLYRPAGWAAVAALLLVAACVAIVSREELVSQMSAARTPGFWLRLWIGILLVATIHEFGHGLTCKFFGGRSHGIGFLWIYGMFCLYCDVSGAWMLPRKSQRLWVGCAGLYYQFIAGAVALLFWRVAEPGTLASQLALGMVASCGFLTAINLNPLLKLDGYYLLSDWLEIPNLRQRAFQTLRERLSRFWLGVPPATTQGPSRERRIFLTYGILATLFLAWLLPHLIWSLGQVLTGRFAGTGALVLFLCVGMVFGAPLSRAGSAGVSWLARWQEIPPTGQRRLLMAGWALIAVPAVLAIVPGELHLANPCKLEASTRGAVRAAVDGRVAELRVREGTVVRRGETMGRLSTFEREQKLAERRAELGAIQAEITALQRQIQGPSAGSGDAAGGVEQAVTRATNGVQQWGKTPGSASGAITDVERRTEAAQGQGYAPHSRLAEARAALEAQRRVTTRLRSDAARTTRGSAPPAIAAARELWQQRAAERDLARRDHQRLQQLRAKGYVSPQQVDAARSRSEVAARLAGEAQQQLKAAQKRLREAADDAAAELTWRQAALTTAREMARVEVLTRRAQLLIKQRQAEQLEAQIAVLDDELQRSALIAPCDGVVTTPRVEERVGASFGEGASVLEVEDARTLCTRIFINERDLGETRTGQPVILRVAAFPERSYQGSIREIAPRAVRGGSAAFPTNIIEARVQIENPAGELRPGMSGWAKIHCGRRPLGGIMLRRVHRYLRTEVWSWF